jgi:ribonuclease HI
MHLYTDGACSGNPGPGGWAFVTGTVERSGGEGRTTNNRMELMAAIQALEYAQTRPLVDRQPLQLTTDSQYVRQGITQWINGWVRKQWRTAKGEFVKNQDLWLRLDALNRALQPDWHWVKAHSGCTGNERADALAKGVITALRQESPEESILRAVDSVS